MEADKVIKDGDVVVFGNTIGHVMYVRNGWVGVDAYFTDTNHNNLLVNLFDIDESNIDVRLANEDEFKEFKSALMKFGYHIKSDTGKLVKSHLWSAGEWVEVRSGESVIKGIITEFDTPRSVVLSASLDKTLIYYSFDIVSSEVRVLKISEKKKALSEFEAAGWHWDPKELRPVRIMPRSKPGQMYWSITDKFTVRCEADNMTEKHNQRYNSGNYFVTPEEANAALQHLLTYLDGLRIRCHDGHDDRYGCASLIGNKAL